MSGKREYDKAVRSIQTKDGKTLVFVRGNDGKIQAVEQGTYAAATRDGQTLTVHEGTARKLRAKWVEANSGEEDNRALTSAIADKQQRQLDGGEEAELVPANFFDTFPASSASESDVEKAQVSKQESADDTAPVRAS